MSRLAITLMRVVIAKARCFGGGTISWSTPSALSRMRNSVLEGLEVDVAGAVADRQQEHHVEQLPHRRALGEGLHARQVGRPLLAGGRGLGGELVVGLQVVDERFHALVLGRR